MGLDYACKKCGSVNTETNVHDTDWGMDNDYIEYATIRCEDCGAERKVRIIYQETAMLDDWNDDAPKEAERMSRKHLVDYTTGNGIEFDDKGQMDGCDAILTLDDTRFYIGGVEGAEKLVGLLNFYIETRKESIIE